MSTAIDKNGKTSVKILSHLDQKMAKNFHRGLAILINSGDYRTANYLYATLCNVSTACVYN